MAKKNSNGSSRSKGLNKHQRSAFKEGEERVGREEIQELLQMSQSEDPTDRLQAPSFLCPCHVRKRIDGVWEALYRMLEDDDLKVRRAGLAHARRRWQTGLPGARRDYRADFVARHRPPGAELRAAVRQGAQKVQGD